MTNRYFALLFICLIQLKVSAQETILLAETFSNGIPSTWTSSESGGIASWEFRGPTTFPDNTMGTRGSCLSAGQEFGEPIESPTRGDGFVIFDSNYWDNDANPCTLPNFGTGQAAGPHFATLETPSFSTIGSMYPAVDFFHYYRRLQGNIRVEVAINGGNWTSIYESMVPAGQATQKDARVRVSLGANAANQSEVKVRFVFDGNYYFWMLDDISIRNLHANDMSVLTASYGDFDFFAPEHTTGWEEMEYTRYPEEMPPLLKFNLVAFNTGYLAQTGVKLRASVENVNTGEILVQQIGGEEFVFQQGLQQEIRAGSFQMPGIVGVYKVIYEILQSEEDGDLNNSRIELFFEITPDVYSRDKGSVASIFFPPSGLDFRTFEVGPVYFVPESDQYVYSISAAFVNGTSTPSSAYAKIYRCSYNGNLSLVAFGETNPQPLEASDFNPFGGQQFVTFTFEEPVLLTGNKAYFAVIGSPDGAGLVYVGLSGTAELNAAWVRFLPSGNQPEQFFTVPRIPMVRVNFGTNVLVDESDQSSELVVYPVPSRDRLFLEVLQGESEGWTPRCFDLSGREVSVFWNKVGSAQWAADISALSDGLYVVQLWNGQKLISKVWSKQ